MAKRQKPTSSSGGSQQAASISKDAYDDLLVSNATHKAQIETLQEQVRVLTESFTEQLERAKAELVVAKEVITQLQKEKAELDAKVTEARRQRPVPAPSAAPVPESDRVERLMRAANDCKVVVFTRGAQTTSTEVCAKLRAAAGLPDYAVAEAFKAGSVWFVKLISRNFTLTALQRWYAFKQLSGWGLDQALTKQQQDERSTLKPRFLELKTAWSSRQQALSHGGMEARSSCGCRLVYDRPRIGTQPSVCPLAQGPTQQQQPLAQQQHPQQQAQDLQSPLGYAIPPLQGQE